MIIDKINSLPVILGSASPRRSTLLKEMGIRFQVLSKDVEESYTSVNPEEIVIELASKKLSSFDMDEFYENLVITADTIVYHEGEVLGKPKTRTEAFDMIKSLCGKTHEVYTGVAVRLKEKRRCFSVCTLVTFDKLAESDIAYYIDNYRPYDKAGGYGIQEWIGRIGVIEISGSYENVIGLPTSRLFKEIGSIL